MVLRIIPGELNSVSDNIPNNVKVINYKLFNMIEVHPFIASTKWDKVEVVLGHGINVGYIKQVLKKNNIVVAVIPDDIELDSNLVSILTTIYPYLGPTIRMNFSRGMKDEIIDLVKKEGVVVV